MINQTCRHSKLKSGDILLVENSPITRLPACVIFSFGTVDKFDSIHMGILCEYRQVYFRSMNE